MRRAATFAVLLLLTACAPSVVAIGPAIDRPRFDPATPLDGAARAIMPDGAALPLRARLPEGPVKAVAIALHGFNDYSNAFAEVAEDFAAAGIATYAYDQRGFGAAPEPGFWFGEKAMVDDLLTMVALARARHPGAPIHLLGESMGGAVVLAALARRPAPLVDGAVLVGPAVWGRASMRVYERVGLWIASHLTPWLALSGRGVGRVPSDNIEMLRRLGRDPLVIKSTRLGTVAGLVDLMDTAAATGPVLVGPPVLIQYGRGDDIVPARAVCAYLATLPPRPPGRWRVALYPKGYHNLTRDLNGAVVRRDAIAFILNGAAPLPSGDEVTVDGVADAAELIKRLEICRDD